MSCPNTIEIEEQALGNWPRRLLYLPTMTSYAWQSGNVYGPVKSPEYNAITYTWGRWKLGDGTKLHVRALEIHRIAWNVPRIDEDHFTATEMYNVLQRSGR